MDHIENKLAAQLYRLTCPSPEDLGEFHLQMLPPQKAVAIAQHLPACPHCAQELTQLQHYLNELAPEISYSFREQVKIWIAQRLPSFSSPGPGGAPTLAFRGQTDEPLMYEAGEYQLNIEIQDDPAKPGHKTILGLLIGADELSFQVQLWQNGRHLQTTAIDELGNFSFTAVFPGIYDLILNRLTTEIHVQAFTV